MSGRYTDFPVKVRKNMIFFVFMISTLKSLEIDSPFEIIEFRDVFCGYFLFEMTLVSIAKSPFHMTRKMISFRNVTEDEKSPIISKRNYPLYFEETVISSYRRERYASYQKDGGTSFQNDCLR